MCIHKPVRWQGSRIMDLDCSSTLFFNLVESCRKVETASDVLSIPHSTEQRGNPTKASGRLY